MRRFAPFKPSAPPTEFHQHRRKFDALGRQSINETAPILRIAVAGDDSAILKLRQAASQALLGEEHGTIATPADARQLLGLKGGDMVGF